jgi:hypothetical protein
LPRRIRRSSSSEPGILAVSIFSQGIMREL